MTEEIKDQIKTMKAELFDLQLMIGTLQNQLQVKMNDLNNLINENKDK